jgi:hypothetical protein
MSECTGKRTNRMRTALTVCEDHFRDVESNAYNSFVLHLIDGHRKGSLNWKLKMVELEAGIVT